MKKQTPEKEPDQDVTAEATKGIIDHASMPHGLWSQTEEYKRLVAENHKALIADERQKVLRQYRCAALTGILAGTNFTGAMEDMVVIARKIGLLMLEADEKEAPADENL